MNEAIAQKSVLVLGTGSIGQRHLRNLRKLGVKTLAAWDPESARLAVVTGELGIQAFDSLDRALDEFRPEIVFVCSPPVFHVAQALRAVRAGAHVFVEKPLSNTVDGIDELLGETERRKCIVQLGYNLRFHPGIIRLKQLLESGVIGRVLWARAEVGQYLPDWRPTQDYRRTYTARQDLGGGIILDASHELDYITWLLGTPTRIVCMAGKVSRLAVDVEDCATILLQFPDGIQADIHMDFVQRGYSRTCKLAGEDGNLVWDYTANEVTLFRAATSHWETFHYEYSPNDMYMAEVRDFLDCVRTGRTPLVTLEQGRAVLEIALAAKSSAAQGSRELHVCQS